MGTWRQLEVSDDIALPSLAIRSMIICVCNTLQLERAKQPKGQTALGIWEQ